MFFLLGLTYAEGDIPSEGKSSNVVGLAKPLSPFAHSRRHRIRLCLHTFPELWKRGREERNSGRRGQCWLGGPAQRQPHNVSHPHIVRRDPKIAREHGVAYAQRFDRRKQLGKRFLKSADNWIREPRRARISTSATLALKIHELVYHRGDGQAVRFEVMPRHPFADPCSTVLLSPSRRRRQPNSTAAFHRGYYARSTP